MMMTVTLLWTGIKMPKVPFKWLEYAKKWSLTIPWKELKSNVITKPSYLLNFKIVKSNVVTCQTLSHKQFRYQIKDRFRKLMAMTEIQSDAYP